VQPTAARRSGRFNKMHGALHALHVSLNNASMRTVDKCLKRNNDHSKFEWNGDIVSGKRHTKVYWNLHPKPKTRYELNVAVEKIWDSFMQVRLIKMARVLQIVWQEYGNGDERHSKHVCLLVFALTALALSWIVKTGFENVSTAKLQWLKAA